MDVEIMRTRSKKKGHEVFLKVKIWNNKEILSIQKVCEFAILLFIRALVYGKKLRSCVAFSQNSFYRKCISRPINMYI